MPLGDTLKGKENGGEEKCWSTDGRDLTAHLRHFLESKEGNNRESLGSLGELKTHV